MAEDDKKLRAKDLLKSGDLEEHPQASAAFGERVMRRHMRRPVGNSRRLWEKVDGDDPWDLPEPPKPEKQRGVYAAGRFVRVDKAEEAKNQKNDEQSHIPEWARHRDQERVPKAEAKPADDPMARIQAEIARRNAENAALAAKANAQAAATPPPVEETIARPEVPIGAQKASISKSGRIRTQRGGSTAPTVVERMQRPDPTEHRYAAGRSAPAPRQAPTDLPIEARSVPRVDPFKKPEPIAPTEHRYAAGRSAPPKRKVKDIPIEERRLPPKIDPLAVKESEAPVQHRYAAGRSAPAPRKKANDLPVEQRRPPRFGPDGKPIPHDASEVAPVAVAPRPAGVPMPDVEPAAAKPAAAKAEPPAAPVDRTPPKPAPTPKPAPSLPAGGNSGSMDDLFGAAQQEGRVRIGRRAKKTGPEVVEDKK